MAQWKLSAICVMQNDFDRSKTHGRESIHYNPLLSWSLGRGWDCVYVRGLEFSCKRTISDTLPQKSCRLIVGKKYQLHFLLRIHILTAFSRMRPFCHRRKMQRSLSPLPTAYWRKWCLQPFSGLFVLVFHWDKPAFLWRVSRKETTLTR